MHYDDAPPPGDDDAPEWIKGGSSPPRLRVVGSSEKADAKPTIIGQARDVADIVRDAWDAETTRPADDSSCYISGDVLCRLHGTTITRVTQPWLLWRQAIVARWVKATRTSMVPIIPPSAIIGAMTEMTPPDRLPRLDAVVTCPVLDRDMQLVTEPGYSPTGYVWLSPTVQTDGRLMPIADAVAAIDTLLRDFPIELDCDRAHYFAYLLAPFLRQAIPGPTPIHLFTSSRPGSGKSLLVDIGHRIFSGREAAAQAFGQSRDQDEMKKLILSLLSSGPSHVCLDNATGGALIDSPDLASAITSTMVKGRILGQSRVVSVSNRAVWTLTGNNPRLTPELTRRCIRIRLVPPWDSPDARPCFAIEDIVRYTTEHRAELVRAILSLAIHWRDAGRVPFGGKPLPSFEPWSQTIGGILDHAGVRGFLGDRGLLREASSSDDSTTDVLVDTWWAEHREQPVTVSQLRKMCATHAILLETLGSADETRQTIRLGRFIASVVDCVSNGRRIRRTPGRRLATYHLEDTRQ